MVLRRPWSWLLTGLLTFALVIYASMGRTADSVEGLLNQGRQRYESGQLDAAKTLLQQAQQQAQSTGDGIHQAIALSNLALIANDQGNWTEANQAITASLKALTAIAPSSTRTQVQAQALNVQGRLSLDQGNAQSALDAWRQSADLYRQVGNPTGTLQSQLRQAQALQALGFYGQAYESLQHLTQQLQQQPDSPTKVWGLRSLGETIGIVLGNVSGDQNNAPKTDLKNAPKTNPNNDLNNDPNNDSGNTPDHSREGLAITITRQSVAIATRLQNAPETAASQLTLANLLAANVRELRNSGSSGPKDLEELSPKALKDLEQASTEAIALYTQVASLPSKNRIRAQLNQLALLIDIDQLPEATRLATRLQADMNALPADRASIAARLNFANSLLRLQEIAARPGSDRRPALLTPAIAQATALTALLTPAIAQATALNDSRLLSNVLGNVARVQEFDQQLTAARDTTERALVLADAAHATDQVYRWSAQLGRLQEKLGNQAGAIAAYTQAVNTLSQLRSDLLGINSETQLLDAETLEPVHRQLVSLLLPKDGSQPTPEILKRTREIIESLQLEEINNYLRAECLQSKVEIDNINVDNKTAVIYPMVLPDRIATIVSIVSPAETGIKEAVKSKPETKTALYSESIPQDTVTATVKELQIGLRNRISLEYKKPSKQLYDWLIRPISDQLKQQKVETLVFVLDGTLRSIPMAALSDGKQFLIEQYSIATTPGLKLTSPKALQTQALSGIAFGLTEARSVRLSGGGSKSFSELPFVAEELKDLQREISPSTVELNQNFTREQFKTLLQKSQSPIVHLATHGQFSSNRDQTFLLAWDSNQVISIDDLTTALSGGNTIRKIPIELLVLSACETAIGDNRAPLGLAGIALKSGARSTVASLWKVNDNATSLLMQQFYKGVATRQLSKAVALQQAQRVILDDPQFRRHPYFWAPFILIGNWL